MVGSVHPTLISNAQFQNQPKVEILMRSAALLFFLGILTAQQLPQLPSLAYLFVLPALALLAWRFPKSLFLFWFACGFCYLWWRADLILAHSLPTHLENIPIKITGKINNVPVREAKSWHFLFDIESISSAGKTTPFELKTKLSWAAAPDLILHAGQRWEFYVKLKPPRSELNFGVFDHSALLFQQGIRATGRVQEKLSSSLLAESSPWELHFQRERLAQQIIQALPQHPESSSILVALVVGVQQFIKPPQWNTIRNTGVTHLIAISGTHITAITVLMFFVSHYIWAIFGGSFWIPAQYIASVLSVSVTWLYVILAGAAVPSLRTTLMISVVMLALLSKRGVHSTNIMAIALWAVLLFDPLAVMALGFWLSFLAFSLLIYSAQAQFFRAAQNPRHRKLALFLLPQIAITIGLFPLLWIWFGTISLASFPANLLAIPIVSLFITPLSLIGTLLMQFAPSLGGGLLTLAAYLWEMLWAVLQFLAQQPYSLLQLSPPPLWAAVASIVGLGLWLSPLLRLPFIGFLGGIWLLPLFLITPARPAQGEAWFTLLDVGQGLSLVVQTAQHNLVYDTGMNSFGVDMGKRVVLPFLKSQGIGVLDSLIISHGDNDHSGGAASILAAMPVHQVLSGQPERFLSAVTDWCAAGKIWYWDSVEFQILHPAPTDLYKKTNNYSCVLKISTAGGAVLFTGDIEKLTEQALLNQARDLAANVLIVPHHGSRTSSSPEFIAAVRPQWALLATGYLNRFHLPKADVVERYHRQQIMTLDTAQVGAIRWQLTAQGIDNMSTARQALKRYWH